MTTLAVRADGDDVLIRVRLAPRSSRDAILEPFGDSVKIAVTSPPVDDKANAHLVKFLSKLLDVPRSRISIVAGGRSRDKTVRVTGIAPDEAARCLSAR